MLPGGTRQLVIPPQLAWGSAGQSPIQPNANVVFQITYLKKF
jgi:FKBP-type peptidyl-prolyl cis-trans isomerase